jgi:hypothetical protein
MELYKKQPLAKTIKIYKPKYKWQKLLPFWFLKIIVKPTTFYNCFPTQIESIVNTNNEFTHNVKFSYKDFVK